MGIITPDGKNLLTASNDQYVLRWKTPQAIYDELKTKDFYKLTNKELEEFKIVK
jgi:hypothetical protein